MSNQKIYIIQELENNKGFMLIDENLKSVKVSKRHKKYEWVKKQEKGRLVKIGASGRWTSSKDYYEIHEKVAKAQKEKPKETEEKKEAISFAIFDLDGTFQLRDENNNCLTVRQGHKKYEWVKKQEKGRIVKISSSGRWGSSKDYYDVYKKVNKALLTKKSTDHKSWESLFVNQEKNKVLQPKQPKQPKQEKLYYFSSSSSENQGPFTLEELKKKNITNNTLVWYEGLEQWKKAENVSELNKIIHKNKEPKNEPDELQAEDLPVSKKKSSTIKRQEFFLIKADIHAFYNIHLGVLKLKDQFEKEQDPNRDPHYSWFMEKEVKNPKKYLPSEELIKDFKSEKWPYSPIVTCFNCHGHGATVKSASEEESSGFFSPLKEEFDKNLDEVKQNWNEAVDNFEQTKEDFKEGIEKISSFFGGKKKKETGPREYFLNNGAKEKGPYGFEELENKPLGKETLVWYEGLENWTLASELRELRKKIKPIKNCTICNNSGMAKSSNKIYPFNIFFSYDKEKENPIELQDQLKVTFEDLVAKNVLKLLDTEFNFDEKFIKNSIDRPEDDHVISLIKQQRTNVFFTEIESLFDDDSKLTYSEVFTKLSIAKGSNDKRDPIEQGAMHIDKIKEHQFVINEAVINKLIKELIENKIIKKGKTEGSFRFTKEVITELAPRIKKLKKYYTEQIDKAPKLGLGLVGQEEANKIVKLFKETRLFYFDIDEKDKKVNNKYVFIYLDHLSRFEVEAESFEIEILELDYRLSNNERSGLYGHYYRRIQKDYKKALEYYSKAGDSYWTEEMKTKIENTTHDFHSSRGLVFCKQCGELRDDVLDHDIDCCKENNHQFQAMKEGGVWKPICKKCGITNRDKYDKCSF